MGKVIIIYESKYGNTRQVAALIAEGMRQVQGTEVILSEIGKVDLNDVSDFDAILLGCPNHMGKATKSTQGLIDSLGELKLDKKKVAVFDTYMSKDFEKAVKNMEQKILERLPGLTLASHGLSIKVNSMKGPIAEGEMPKCREFGIAVGKALLS
jgi:flavorubredoxin